MNKLFLRIISMDEQIESMEEKIRNDLVEVDQIKTGLSELKNEIAKMMKEKGMHNFSATDEKGNRFMFYEQEGNLKFMKV